MGVSIGVDAGSKTIKLVIVDEQGGLSYSSYRRHRADIRATLHDLLKDAIWHRGNVEGSIAITGSAGMGVAEALRLPFVQEVIATSRIVKLKHPKADAVIELGGEDAKVMYLTGTPEQRMNATCAGGTGGFLDTVAYMMGVRVSDLNELGMSAKHTHPIASRCAVFAQTDIRPLLNAGVRKADIAASALEAVVRQTLGGLACGRPIRGSVVFLGGPLEHIPDLVDRFRKALNLTRETGLKPDNAHLYAAMGAALTGASQENSANVSLGELLLMVESAEIQDDSPRLPALFESAVERELFLERAHESIVPRTRLFDCEGSLFVGIDAGSTAVKIAVVDEGGRLAYSDYQSAGGDVIEAASALLKRFYQALPRAYGGESLCSLAHATVTGYGEELLKAALSVDSGVVETVAHTTAALHVCPDASFLLDIGGQDMKAIWIEEGHIADAVLNEACSSGCGAFVSGTAHALKLTQEEFSNAAMRAGSPLDLGTKCTVFMSSKVKHAQKSGVSLDDIAGGVAYSVARNALLRVLGGSQALPSKGAIVVQGGAFMDDAVLRAFELVTGRVVVRPDKAHVMGALGAALVARERAHASLHASDPTSGLGAGAARSTLASREKLQSLRPTREARRCQACANHCLLSVVSFGDGGSFLSGNRCDRAAGHLRLGPSSRRKALPPNAIALKQKLLARYRTVLQDGDRGQIRLGIVASMDAYDQIPFWHALLTSLRFSVVVPQGAGPLAATIKLGLDTIPSESVCYPAKLSHARVESLIEEGVSALFMPSFERGRRCPVSSAYACVLEGNVSAVLEGGVAFLRPQLRHRRALFFDEVDAAAVYRALSELAEPCCPIGRVEFDAAFEKALAAQSSFVERVSKGNQRAYAWANEREGKGVVLQGRPYHCDPAVLHGVDALLQDLGFSVISGADLRLDEPWIDEDDRDCALRPRAEAWDPAARSGLIARSVAKSPRLQMVYLHSFGCGMDALAVPDVRDIVRRDGKPFTAIKMDDMVDTAHVRIRLRTHAETAERRLLPRKPAPPEAGGEHFVLRPAPSTCVQVLHARAGSVRAFADLSQEDVDAARAVVPDLCFVATALAGRAVRIIAADPGISELVVPEVCRTCLLQHLPSIVKRACGVSPCVSWVREWPASGGELASQDTAHSADLGKPFLAKSVGVVGAAPLCFDAFMNDGIERIARSQGYELAYPCKELIFVDDVRYLEQLEEFVARGIDRVVYLQSFGCLKGHICSRGALREIERAFPTLALTVLDYDVESSSLNRENRIRLALGDVGP